MKEKVVYLFGAGASFNAIPVVSGMGIRLRTFLNYFKYYKMKDHYENVLDPRWSKLVDEVNESYSIDTLARRAWLSDDMAKLSEIKQLIGAYILWEQIVKPDQSNQADFVRPDVSLTPNYVEATNRFNYYWDGSALDSDSLRARDIKLRNYDYRYESLLSVIADKYHKIDDRFGFVSWNYDNQLELAVARVFNLLIRFELNGQIDEERVNRIIDELLCRRFVKLNGSASLSNFDFEPVGKFQTGNRDLELKKILDFLMGKEVFTNRIYFAWESNHDLDRNRALKLLTEAKYVVIVGYSFPEYNREIDKLLINAAFTGINKHVIVQDTVDNVERIVNRIQSIRQNVRIEKYTDLNQFYIPL